MIMRSTAVLTLIGVLAIAQPTSAQEPRLLPPAAIPSTLVLDREGRVAARALGEVDYSRLLGILEPVMREQA